MKQKQKKKHLEDENSSQTAKRAREVSPGTGPSGSVQGRKNEANSSIYILCTFPMDKTVQGECQKLPENASKPHITQAAESPAKEECSSNSVYLSCISSPSNLPPPDSKAMSPKAGSSKLTKGHAKKRKNSQSVPCTSSVDKPIQKGCQKFHVITPEIHVTHIAEGESSSSSEYFSCVSSPSKICLLDKKAMSPKAGPSRLAKSHIKKTKTSKSTLRTSMDKPIHKEWLKSQVNAPESHAACSPADEESSSDSVYFSCVSSPSNLPLIDRKQQIHKVDQHFPYFEFSPMPATQHLKNKDSSSPFQVNYFPVCLDDHKPSTSSAPMDNERVMKVYYMHVHLKRGVAILPETEELEHPRKKIKLDNIMFPERIPTEINHSEVCTHELLCDSEVSVNGDTQERLEESECPNEPEALEERARPKTPEWLVALDHGYRCMACCRVFPSLEILQDHVEHGVNDGFSCHTFHLALASLRNKRKHKKKQKRSKTPEQDTFN
ncbi:uncharacterized protein RHO17_014329 [Thomomys bottae]